MTKRNTKIICTIGPSINSEMMLEKMFNTGMNVARINFSHGTHESAAEQIKKIRTVSAKVNKHIGIMLDTKGPEIRIGKFANGSCTFEAGDKVKLVKDEVVCDHEKLYVTCKELFDDVKANDMLLIDDGKITIKVLNVSSDEIECEFVNGGVVKNNKGINAPGINLSMPFISQKDYDDILFGCKEGVDLIALSFVRTADDVKEVKALLAEFGRPYIEVISKIECQQAVENIEEILQVSDGIMVARGDLGVEVAPEFVPMYQKQMIKLANSYGKPAIIATHMLESMIENSRPTRAEASDVANAILDGCDAIMLSGESAVGKYPVDSVSYMVKIAEIAESMLDHSMFIKDAKRNGSKTKNDAISLAAAETCLSLLDVKAIFAFTETGGTVKRLCRFRPKAPVYACTNSIETARKLSYYRGIKPVIATYFDELSKCDEITKQVASQLGFKSGDTIILLAGFGEKHGITNTLRIIELD